MTRYANSLVACARWETDTIAEWLLYHRSIGFDHVYLYCNDDDPHELYERILPFNLGTRPFVTFLFHPVQGDQYGMYRHFLQHYRQDSERFMFLDIDEFLCLRGVDNIRAFIADGFEDCDDLYFNWVWFGHSGYAERPRGSVLNNYTRRADGVFILTKHLVRSSVFDRLFDPATIGGPFHHALPDSAHGSFSRRNVLGEDFSHFLTLPDPQKGAYLSQGDRVARILAKGCIFHYAFKSRLDLLTRAKRGMGGSFSGQVTWKELYESGNAEKFFEPLNQVEETYLRNYWTRLLDGAEATLSAPRPEAGSNIALYGKAEQSSVSEWSRRPTAAEDATGGISGAVTGRFQFHTALEDRPWWRLIFPETVTVEQIRLYNRLDVPDRANNLQVSIRVAENEWTQVGQWVSANSFGGADGKPFVLKFSPPLHTDAVRVRLGDRNYLHLDQVEVIGQLPEGLKERLDQEAASSLAETPALEEVDALTVSER